MSPTTLVVGPEQEQARARRGSDDPVQRNEAHGLLVSDDNDQRAQRPPGLWHADDCAERTLGAHDAVADRSTDGVVERG